VLDGNVIVGRVAKWVLRESRSVTSNVAAVQMKNPYSESFNPPNLALDIGYGRHAQPSL
jgi:hypothetical protein